MRVRCVLLLILGVLAAPRSAPAWGFEVHKEIMARAIPLLPAEIRPFFEERRTALVEHAIDPDLWRTVGWEAEPPRHFLDMDAYGPYPFARLPRAYDDAVARYGRAFVEKNGLLPWRAAEIYDKLVEAFRQATPYARDNITLFSSVLTHYESDAHVPFHAAVNYDGQLTGQRGIHSRFEAELFERNRSVLTLAPGPVRAVGPVRDFIFDTLLESFPLVQPVLDADRQAAAGRDYYDDEYFTMFFSRVRPILERRISESIAHAASLITAAWTDAGRPAVPVQAPRVPRKIRRD
jgi:hypothetical protein